MKHRSFALSILFLVFAFPGYGQEAGPPKLNINDFMEGPSFVGHLPQNIRWSHDSREVYFRWNPEDEPLAAMYRVSPGNPVPVRMDAAGEFSMLPRSVEFNKARDKILFVEDGDIILMNLADRSRQNITSNLPDIRFAEFSADESAIIYSRNDNLLRWDMGTGQTEQLTNFVEEDGSRKTGDKKDRNFLERQQEGLFEYFREQDKKEKARKAKEALKPETKEPVTLVKGKKSVWRVQMSPDEHFISYILFDRNSSTHTEVPQYVTRSGYTENIRARAKVGSSYGSTELFIYDLELDSLLEMDWTSLPGIRDIPEYKKEYGITADEGEPREVMATRLTWSDDGRYAAINIRSLDNKDRWIVLFDAVSREIEVLDRQHDDAWIGGPGIGWTYSGGVLGWLPDNKHIYFQSEETGYAHLYLMDVEKKKKKQLTEGAYEIYDPFISNDRQSWYFTSNQVHPGERHFYRMPLYGGKAIRLTTMSGRNDVSLSPDESYMAIRHSYANRPWELYLKELAGDAEPVRVTESYTDAFRAYPWREPELIRFEASDGVMVPARLYRPDETVKNGAGVIFVHGAGYLQNAHKWWSSYYREYMFHNFLADHGYTVLDIDYRGSAGYGRDWRTAIYRHMGGKDLGDQVDGAAYLVSELDVDPGRIGIYGGSYGGFITLMAMFTEPGVFAAGAALRSVTDWAHYNHGYTSNILNTPEEDSIAYQRSSPVYFAEGLQGALLICHGMIDDNVHFQDVVRLSQRLIELGKENWELAVYPVERHSFTEPSSWSDEYRRIFRLFETHLGKDD